MEKSGIEANAHNEQTILRDVNHSSDDTISSNLVNRYREVLFSCLVTSFGLDAILFKNDEEHGHVDTIHNVVDSYEKTGDPVFKSDSHRATYNVRGKYDSTAYHNNEAYIDKGRQWKEDRDAGILKDSYTGKKIERWEKFDRDHVVAAKTIHDDPRRALSGLDGVELANQDSNLQPTHYSINRSKNTKSADKFVDDLGSRRAENQKKADDLRIAISNGSAPEGASKKLNEIEALLSVDDKRLKEAAKISENAQSRQHNSAYYMSADFLGTTGKFALEAGCKMGVRQGLGLVLMELSVSVQDELPIILQHWKESPTWQKKLDFKHVFERVAAAFKRAWERVSNKLGHLWKEVKDGFAAGVLSEIVTTVINIFTGTAKSVMKILRSFWSAIVSSLRILIQNPDNLGPVEKITAVMRILSVSVGGIIQPIISESIDKLLAIHAPVLPRSIVEALSEFFGAAVGGIVSVSLVYAIDNSPIVAKVVEIIRKAGAFTEAVYQKISQISGVAWQYLKNGVGAIMEAADSPAVNLLAFVAFPPLGAALYLNSRFKHIDDRFDRLEQTQARIEGKIDRVDATMIAGFSAIERMIRENSVLLGCVIEGQERQMQMLSEIRKDIKEGFEHTHNTIHQAKIEGAELVAIRMLQENLNGLLSCYRDCAALLSRGVMPEARDFERVEGLALALIDKYYTAFEGQKSGAPARLPLLSGMVFALGAWQDARNTLGDGLEMCFERARFFAELSLKELHTLTDNASFWQLAEENSWLIGQYVLLRRFLILMPSSSQNHFALNVDEDFSLGALSFTQVAWNDGLQMARDLFEEAQYEQPLEILPIRTFADRDGLQQFLKLPREVDVTEISLVKIRQQLGIPENVIMGNSALELMREAPGLIAGNKLALQKVFA